MCVCVCVYLTWVISHLPLLFLSSRHLFFGCFTIFLVHPVWFRVSFIFFLVLFFLSFFFFLLISFSLCISAWVICISHSLFLSHHSLCISRSCNSCARALRVWLNSPSRLIVSFLLEPASWIPAEVESSRLVVDEDGEHEGEGGQPPDESEIHNTRVYTSLRAPTSLIVWIFICCFKFSTP